MNHQPCYADSNKTNQPNQEAMTFENLSTATATLNNEREAHYAAHRTESRYRG